MIKTTFIQYQCCRSFLPLLLLFWPNFKLLYEDLSFGRSRSESVLPKTRRFRVCKPEVPVLRPKTRRFRFRKPEVPVLLCSAPIPATPRVTAPTSAPPLKLSTTLHWPTPFWLRRSPSSRRERSQANPSAAAHRAGHPVAVSPPFFEPKPSPSHSTSPRTSTAPSRARPSPIPAESAPSLLARHHRPPSPAALLHDPASPTVPNPDSTHPEVALYLLKLFPHFPLTAGDRARRNPAGQRRRAPSPILSPCFCPQIRKFRVWNPEVPGFQLNSSFSFVC